MLTWEAVFHSKGRAVYNTEHDGFLQGGESKWLLFYKESISRNNSEMEIYVLEMLYIFLYIAPGDILL